MKDKEEAYKLLDLFQWAMDDGWTCLTIKTFFSKYPTGKRQIWEALFWRDEFDEKYLIEGPSIDELYKNMEQYFLSGKGKVTTVPIKDLDLL